MKILWNRRQYGQNKLSAVLSVMLIKECAHRDETVNGGFYNSGMSFGGRIAAQNFTTSNYRE
jgi:hypothetical protein